MAIVWKIFWHFVVRHLLLGLDNFHGDARYYWFDHVGNRNLEFNRVLEVLPDVDELEAGVQLHESDAVAALLWRCLISLKRIKCFFILARAAAKFLVEDGSLEQRKQRWEQLVALLEGNLLLGMGYCHAGRRSTC